MAETATQDAKEVEKERDTEQALRPLRESPRERVTSFLSAMIVLLAVIVVSLAAVLIASRVFVARVPSKIEFVM